MSSLSAGSSAVPAVSVGMPVYNSAAWIQSAIESLLAQTFQDFELIISDNASTDATFAICERYARSDSRIRLFKNDQNIGANRNYCAVLQQGRADYFKWAASNDLCAPTFIEKCVIALENEPTAVLACPQTALFDVDPSDAKPYDRDVLLTADEGNARYVDLFHMMGLNNAFNGVIRRRALVRAAPLGNFQQADIVLMAELALMGKFLVIPELLFFRRMSPDSATKLKSAKEVDQHIEPESTRPLRWQNWRFYGALLQAVLRQRPFTSDSVKALRYVLKQIRWSRWRLARDVRQAITAGKWQAGSKGTTG